MNMIAELRAQLATAETTIEQTQVKLKESEVKRKRAEHALAGMLAHQAQTGRDVLKLVDDKVRAYGAVAIMLRLLARDIVKGQVPLCDVPIVFDDVLHVIDRSYGSFLAIADADPVSRRMLDELVQDAMIRRRNLNAANAITIVAPTAPTTPSPWIK